MNTRKAWLTYIALRLLFFAAPFALLLWLLSGAGWSYWPKVLVSTTVAALVSVSLSVILLSKQREAASTSIHDWRTREHTEDDLVEDEAVEALAPEESPTDAAAQVEDHPNPDEQR